jgi:predicted nucleic acid-binding protein
MKLYLDTCIVSGLIKEDLGKEEFSALDRILAAWQAHQVELCTSKVTLEELSKVPALYRREHNRIYKLIRLVPIAPEARTDSGLSLMGVGGGTRTDPLFTNLKQLLDEVDAKHVFQALKNHVETFLTVDNGILKKNRELGELGITVMKPSQLQDFEKKGLLPKGKG